MDWNYAKVITGYSGFLHHSRVAGHDIALITLYIKNTFSGEVTGSCWLFSSHFSYAWIEMKNQFLTFPNKGIALQQLSTV